MSNRRLIKFFLSFAMAFSVFLSCPLIARADDSEDFGISGQADLSDQWLGEISLSGSRFLFPVYFYDRNSADSSYPDTVYLNSTSFNSSYLVTMSGFEPGNVYNGQIRFYVDLSLSLSASSSFDSFFFGSVSFHSYSLPDGISLSFTNSSFGWQSSPYSGRFLMTINFSNFVCTSSQFVYFNFYAYADLLLRFINFGDYSSLDSSVYFTMALSSSEYTGSVSKVLLTDDSSSVQGILDNIDTSINYASENQMAQQESIAAAQAEQSAQQHQEVVSGYDSSSADSVAASQSAQLDSYQAQQDAAFDDANSKITDFTSTSFTTAPIASMATSFAFVSTLFNLMWSGFGEFTVLLVVSLSLGVAGIILKLKKGG